MCVKWEFVEKKFRMKIEHIFGIKIEQKKNKKSIEQTHLNDESPTFAIEPFTSSKSAVNVTTEPLIAGAFDFTRSKKSREYATIVISSKADSIGKQSNEK